jgi:hypothetical protein
MLNMLFKHSNELDQEVYKGKLLKGPPEEVNWTAGKIDSTTQWNQNKESVFLLLKSLLTICLRPKGEKMFLENLRLCGMKVL